MGKYGHWGQKLEINIDEIGIQWTNLDKIKYLSEFLSPSLPPDLFELQKRHLVFKKLSWNENQNRTLPFRINISLNITPFGQKTRSTLQITFTNGKLQILVRNTLIQIRFGYENCQRSFLDFGFKIQSKGRGHIRHSFDF